MLSLCGASFQINLLEILSLMYQVARLHNLKCYSDLTMWMSACDTFNQHVCFDSLGAPHVAQKAGEFSAGLPAETIADSQGGQSQTLIETQPEPVKAPVESTPEGANEMTLPKSKSVDTALQNWTDAQPRDVSPYVDVVTPNPKPEHKEPGPSPASPTVAGTSVAEEGEVVEKKRSQSPTYFKLLG